MILHFCVSLSFSERVTQRGFSRIGSERPLLLFVLFLNYYKLMECHLHNEPLSFLSVINFTFTHMQSKGRNSIRGNQSESILTRSLDTYLLMNKEDWFLFRNRLMYSTVQHRDWKIQNWDFEKVVTVICLPMWKRERERGTQAKTPKVRLPQRHTLI